MKKSGTKYLRQTYRDMLRTINPCLDDEDLRFHAKIMARAAEIVLVERE